MDQKPWSDCQCDGPPTTQIDERGAEYCGRCGEMTGDYPDEQLCDFAGTLHHADCSCGAYERV